jgi:hypothetical protein
MNKPTPEEKCSHEFYEVPKRMDIPVKCAKCGVMIDDSPSPEALKLQDPLPHNITFHNKDGKVIGEFNFDKLPCTFKGDVDESAKVFVDVVSQLITQRLQPSPEARVAEKKETCILWAFVGEQGHIAYYDNVPCLYKTRKRAWESAGFPLKDEIKKVRVTMEVL